MALIGKIRQNPFIVLLFIGGGILLFVFSEMTGGGNGPVGPAEQIMARVGQTEIDRVEFERTLASVYSGGDAFENRDNLFQFYVNEGLITEEAAAAGLYVSEEELRQLEFGPNYSPVVRRNFQDQRTGQFNIELLQQIQTSLDNNTLDADIRDGRLNPGVKEFWKYQRREIKAARLQEKLGALVSKSMYAPTWQAQQFADQQLASRRVAVTTIPFSELSDVNVSVEDADVQAYVNEYKSLFNNPEETRQLVYTTFTVEATEQDRADLRETLGEIKADWMRETTARGDSLFAISNQGSYRSIYETADKLNEDIATEVVENLEEGSIYGPYVEGEAMKLVKLIDRVEMADSASTRHILIRATTPDQIEAATARIDSLKTVLRANPRKWNELAEEFNEDQGSQANNGRYDGVTPGQFVRNYDNVLFRTGRIGEYYTVPTSYGIHLVEILNRARTTKTYVKVAYAVEPIVPSTNTEDAVLAKAQEFLAGLNGTEDLRTKAEAAGMEVTTTSPLPITAYRINGLGGGQEVRDMMCWAFGADKGQLSDQVYSFANQTLYYDDKYVVAGVSSVIPAGPAPVAAVKENLSDLLTNRKRGEQVMGNLTSVSAAAGQYDVTVDTITVNPTQTSAARIGAEPKVIAAASALTTGQTKAVVGNNGVYVIEALTDAGTGTSGSVPAARQQLNLQVRNQSTQGILPALRASADIEDDRTAGECF